MAKANRKGHSVFPVEPTMLENFKKLHTILRNVSESSQEIMPLFAAAIDLAIKILRMYEKAFEAGKKYAPRK